MGENKFGKTSTVSFIWLSRYYLVVEEAIEAGGNRPQFATLHII